MPFSTLGGVEPYGFVSLISLLPASDRLFTMSFGFDTHMSLFWIKLVSAFDLYLHVEIKNLVSDSLLKCHFIFVLQFLTLLKNAFDLLSNDIDYLGANAYIYLDFYCFGLSCQYVKYVVKLRPRFSVFCNAKTPIGALQNSISRPKSHR